MADQVLEAGAPAGRQAGSQGSALAEQVGGADGGAGREGDDVARRDLLQAVALQLITSMGSPGFISASFPFNG